MLTQGSQYYPSIAMDPSGSFVVTWQIFPREPETIWAREFSCSPLPGPVSDLMLESTGGGAGLLLTWADAADAVDYLVFEDGSPDGTFVARAGNATSGATGLALPMPGGSRFFRVAARNDQCGEGPK